MDFSNLKEFHCSICDKLFDSEERCPKMLSCGHSFCLTCLDKIFPDCPSCPICKTYIQFSSVDLIPVNLLIRNCVAKINVQSGVKRKDFAELNGAENNSSIERDAKRQKLASVGYCDKHENFNELRCMNCEIWICSMCAILNHKKCDTLLVEEAFKEVQKKSDQIIDNLLDIKKSRLVRVYNSSKALEEKNKSLKLDIVDLKLKIESKLNEIKENDIELDSLRDKIVDEKEISLNLKEIQLLTKTSFSIKNLKELMEAKTKLDTLFQEQVKSPEGYEIETESIEYIEESSDLEKFILQSEDGEVVSESKDADFVPNKMDNSEVMGDSRVKCIMNTTDQVALLDKQRKDVPLGPNSGVTQKIVCAHCNKQGHNQDKCFTLHPNRKLGRKCYSCGDNGHLAQFCPWNNNNNNRGSNNINIGNQGKISILERKCYFCNIYGHYANACPRNNNNNNRGSNNNNIGNLGKKSNPGGGRKCYNCQTYGHLANVCPNICRPTVIPE